jgi:hypothetical protein
LAFSCFIILNEYPFSYLKEEVVGIRKDRPWPVSRKTSKEGVKKYFLFEPLGEFKIF